MSTIRMLNVPERSGFRGAAPSDMPDMLSSQRITKESFNTGLMLQQVIFFRKPMKAKQLLKGSLTHTKVIIRIVNHPESALQIRLLKASSIGSLVTISGTVIRMSPVRPQISQLDFECSKCCCSTSCRFDEGRYMPPSACPGEGCRSRSFRPLRSAAQSVDWQKIMVQVKHMCASFLGID